MHVSPRIPTLDDVANAAGVSTATVSRCLNEKQKVSPKTLTKVIEAVRATVELCWVVHFTNLTVIFHGLEALGGQIVCGAVNDRIGDLCRDAKASVM